MPGYVDRWLAANALGASIVALSLIGVGAFQFFGWWRSRQIVAVLALIGLDRAAARHTFSPPASAPESEVVPKRGRRHRSP